MTNAISGPGFLLQLGTTAIDASATFATIAEVKDITGPAMSLDVIDVTNQDSPDAYEEIIPSIRRGGEVDFDVNFVPTDATHDDSTGLVYLANNKIKRAYRLLLNDDVSSYFRFTAYVIGFQIKAPVAGVLAGTTKLRITAKPVLVAGGS